MTRIDVRVAGPEDAEALAGVHVRAWQEAYRHVLSADFLDRLDPQQRLAPWRLRLADGSPEFTVLAEVVPEVVAKVVPEVVPERGEGRAAEVVGFASRRPSTEGPRPLELSGIYLLSAWHGTGVAQRLLNAALGEQPCHLWVAEDNPRAHAFYRRNGFAPDGQTRVVGEWENLKIVCMVR